MSNKIRDSSSSPGSFIGMISTRVTAVRIVVLRLLVREKHFLEKSSTIDKEEFLFFEAEQF